MGLVLIKMGMLIIVQETTAVRVAPIVSEVGAELENLYLGWNPVALPLQRMTMPSLSSKGHLPQAVDRKAAVNG